MYRRAVDELTRRLAVARGDEPADLVVRGGRVLSVFTREWLETDVAVVDGFVAGLGEYQGAKELDASGRYVVPGFIDAHVHLESSKLMLDEFARLVLPLGTTTVVVDPHEIANVLGTDGVHWLLDFCADLPLDVYFMAPSCVPASTFESPRRALNDGDLEGLLRRRRVLGLAEMMNFPGVIAGAPSELAKLETGLTDHVDGHAPGVRGPALNAYIAAGIGSDHEATTFEEALDFVGEIGSPWLGVVLEVNNAWIERRLYHNIETRAPAIALVQVSDFKVGTRRAGERVVIGDGDVPLRRICGTLADAGYAGWYEIELLGPAIEAEGYASVVPRAVARFRELWT